MRYTFTFEQDSRVVSWEVDTSSLAQAWRLFWACHGAWVGYVACHNQRGWLADSESYPKEMCLAAAQ